MTTWTEWFAYLDGRLERSLGGQLPELDKLIQGSRPSPAEPGVVARGRRARVFDELGSTALFLDALVESAAASHLLAASLLYSQGKGASWLPAALPNSEESRLVKRAARCRDRCAGRRAI
jgi:hypothetical protein